MLLVIDDLLLLELLGGVAPTDVVEAANRGEVFTTGSWYYRLGRAISVGTGTGSLSGRFSGLADGQRHSVLASLDELPDHIGLLSLRIVVPVMQALTVERPLNFLSAEALGAALLLDASVVVSTDAPLLRSGCADLAVSYRLAGTG